MTARQRAKGTKDVFTTPSRSRVRKIAIDGRSEPELLRMVRGHYDSEPLMRLEARSISTLL